MNGDGADALAVLLMDPDVTRMEALLRGISASTAGGAQISAALLDVLLSFDLRGLRPADRTRDALLRAAIAHERHLPVWEPHQRVLQTLLVRVLGCHPDDIELTHEPGGGGDAAYWLASRCAAARIAEPAVARAAPETARDCCLFLQRCEYLPAVRALSSLSAPGSCAESRYATEVLRFREQARSYLAAFVRIHPQPVLQWEWFLCEHAA